MRSEVNTTTARIWMRRWLMCLGLLVYSMILIGGATRLTDSGLSITEWDPIAGALPPFGDAAWASLFDKYKTTAEYRLQNAGMTLGEFKYIFWWEWGHRLFGRLIGLVAVGGFIAFWLRGWLTRPLAIRFGILIALGGLQGFIGWWMVASGIGETSRVDVAPYRLMTHFCLALLIIALITWTWLSLGRGETRDQVAAAPQPASARPVAIGLLVLVAIQLASGALVAGLDAGRSYTDWPLMAGEVFPSDYVEGGLGFRSLFEGRAATQFNHRLLAYLLWGSAILAWLLHRGGPAERSFGVFALLVSGQAIWGILTLVNAAPLSLALLHQGLGVVILLAAVTLVWRANARVADKAPLTVLA